MEVLGSGEGVADLSPAREGVAGLCMAGKGLTGAVSSDNSGSNSSSARVMSTGSISLCKVFLELNIN